SPRSTSSRATSGASTGRPQRAPWGPCSSCPRRGRTTATAAASWIPTRPSLPRPATSSTTAPRTTCERRSGTTTSTTTTSTRSSSLPAPTGPTPAGSTGCTTGTPSAKTTRAPVVAGFGDGSYPPAPAVARTIVRVSTRGVSDRTVGPRGRRGRGHDPLLPGQGPAGGAQARGAGDLLRGRARGAAEADQRAAAAGIHPHR